MRINPLPKTTAYLASRVFKKKSRPAANRLRQIRNYQAALQNRLTNDWLTGPQAVDDILRWQLPKLRERSRDLWRNNDYARAFGHKLRVNVVGSQGIQLQNKAKNPDDKLDTLANKKIEEAFKYWSDPKNCTVTGRLSRHDLDQMIIENVARDGEAFIQKVRGFDNDFGFALQMIDPDLVDQKFNRAEAGKNRVIMGVEVNDFGRPIQYWMKAGGHRTAVPASQMIHLYDQDRPDQHRGVPWVHTAILRLRSLGAYEEAAIIAARVGASGMGFVIKPGNEDAKFTGETDGEDQDSGAYLDDVAPGAFLELPVGADFKTYDPSYPQTNHADFMKAVLKGASAGLNMSYNSLSGDLEGVNYSSIRQGVLEDRDNYKTLTRWMASHVHADYFKEWLLMATTTGQVKLPVSKVNELARPTWQGRGFDWIDPLKDITSKQKELEVFATSPQRIASERGMDLEDILDEHVRYYEMLNERKLKLGPTDEKTQPDPKYKDDGTDDD
jgi:lambda family phage portal protein